MRCAADYAQESAGGALGRYSNRFEAVDICRG